MEEGKKLFLRMKIDTKQSVFANIMPDGRIVDSKISQLKATCQYLTEV